MTSNRRVLATLLGAVTLSLSALAVVPSGPANANPGGNDGLTQQTDPSYTSVGVSCNNGSCPAPAPGPSNASIEFP